MNDLSSATGPLHLVAVHVVARARQQATGRFSLRVTPGGFGTPEFGDDAKRVRVSGGTLIAESDAPGAAASTALEIDGASLRELAALAGVDLAATLDVGHETPDVGDPEAPLDLDPEAATALGEWFGTVAAVLDRVVAAVPSGGAPTLARLWPEHFDTAVEAVARPGVRVNLGGSPGDGYIDEPYFYIGPWTADRPGDPAFWNAPFGSARRRSDLDENDLVGSAAAYLLDGLQRLATPIVE
jgi:hypothetical protein